MNRNIHSLIGGGVNDYMDPIDINTMSAQFAQVYPDISELLGAHAEHSIVLNDITQKNKKDPKYKSNYMIWFHKLEGETEEILTDSQEVINSETRYYGRQEKREIT